MWGNNNPVMWGFPIVNFVFWVGIGHAGTLISAILFLFRQKWRTAINRFAEAMTIFAVICAGTFPGIHVGRIWVAYWLFPIPNQMDDVAAVPQPAAVGRLRGQHVLHRVAAVFWYVGLIPDLATLRDRSKDKIRAIAYGLFSLGWRGSTRHWQRYERAYLLLAASRRRWCSPCTRRVVRLRRVAAARLAHDDLPAVLRRGCDLLRLRRW